MTTPKQIAGPTEAMLADGWIKHDGGPCPVPLDSRPGVMLHNGWSQSFKYNLTARSFRWGPTDDHDEGYVTAYKPEQPQ